MPVSSIAAVAKAPSDFSGKASSEFALPLAPVFTPPPLAAAEGAAQDELELYLSLPQEMDMDLDVLAWWRARDYTHKSQLGAAAPMPNLAKMVRQFLGRPASSAGVERAFSKAGRLHDDMKAGQSDDTLEHALLAGKNCD